MKSEKKLRQISLSKNTVQRRISDLADDIKQQVISNIKNAQFCIFSIQFDKSTDVSACFQLMVFAEVVSDIKNAQFGLFSVQLDKSTDVSVALSLWCFADNSQILT